MALTEAARHLHDPDGRRRPGRADPGADHLDRGRHHRDARGLRVRPRPRAASASSRAARARSAIAAGVLGVHRRSSPGLPSLPFLLAGGACSACWRTAWRGRRRRRRGRRGRGGRGGRRRRPSSVDDAAAARPAGARDRLRAAPAGRHGRRAATCSTASALLRRQLALDLGFVVPPIRVRDNAALARQPVRDQAARHRGRARRGAIPTAPGDEPRHRRGRSRRARRPEPAFGLPAALDRRSRSATPRAAAGYTVVDASTVVATHLTEVIRRHAPTLLGRQDVQALRRPARARRTPRSSRSSCRAAAARHVHRVLQRLLARGRADPRPADRPRGARRRRADDEGPRAPDRARARRAAGRRLPPVRRRRQHAPRAHPGARHRARAHRGLGALEGDEGGGRASRSRSSTPSPARWRPLRPSIPPGAPVSCAAAPALRRLTERRLPHLGVLSYAEVPPTVSVACGRPPWRIDHAAQAV